MKRKLVVAAIQPNAESCYDENQFYKKIYRLSFIAKQCGAQVVVFPEGLSMWLSWCKESHRVNAIYQGIPPKQVKIFNLKNWVEKLSDWFFSMIKLNKMGEWLAQSQYYRIMYRTFSKVAKELEIVIVGGSLYTHVSNDGMLNVSMVFEKDGRLIATPGKKYLMPIEESWGFDSATNVEPVITSVGCIGVCICYDLDFPDVVCDLKRKGAEFICAPSGGWRPYPGYPFDIVKDMPQKERAKESGLFIIRPYQCGWMAPGMYFDGRTSIVNKFGNVVESSKSTQKEEVIITSIEIGE